MENTPIMDCVPVRASILRADLLQSVEYLREDGFGMPDNIPALDQNNLEAQALEELEPGPQALARDRGAAVDLYDDRLFATDVLDDERADRDVTNEPMGMKRLRLHEPRKTLKGPG